MVLDFVISLPGHQVVGVDISHDLVTSVNSGTIKTDEPGVINRVSSSIDKLSATIDPHEAIQNTSLSFIIVPTPSNTLGGFSLRYVLKACEAIGKALREKKGYHVVSLVSTVLPGSSDQIIIPKLEETSNRKIGHDLGYCYNPSFIAQGEIVKGIEQPDFILLGESDKKAGDIVLTAHELMTPDSTPITRMIPVEAEITKLASNTHETMRVSFANMLMAACSEIPNANVDHITQALSHRMGKRFFKGAVPYGGPCWPRDNKALSTFLDAIHVPHHMPYSVDRTNADHGRYILRKILEISSPESKIGLIGLAYKPGTPMIERAFAVDLIHWLLAERRSVTAWDPMAMPEVSQLMGNKINLANSGTDCLQETSIIVLINPLKELDTVDWSYAKEKTVIDCWRCLKPAQIQEIGHYIPLGKGEKTDLRTWLTSHLGNKLKLLTN